MTYPPAGFPPPSGPYSAPDPFQGMSSPANPNPFQQAGPPPAAPSPFGAGAWQPPVFQAGYGQAPPTPEPPRSSKRWLVITVVVAVVIAAAGTGTLLWWLNARGGESSHAVASPLPTSVPPLGALRPPRDQLVSSLEKPLDEPRWSYRSGTDITDILGGDAHTFVVGVVSDKPDGSRGLGVLALDADNGAPRWPKPVIPAVFDQISGFTHAKCVISRAATIIGCAVARAGNTDGDEPAVLVFLDTATGAELASVSVPATRWGRVREMYSAGNGFVVVLNDAVVGYRTDGSEAWRIAYQSADLNSFVGHEGISVYGDQAIVVTQDGQVLDADTGNPLVRGAQILGSAAFASGFALSNRETIDFYDFGGTKMASVPAEGFKLMDGYGTDGFNLSVGLNFQNSGSSGLYSPMVYSETTGDLRAVDPRSGRVLWNRHVGRYTENTIAAYGNGTTCFIILQEQQVLRVKVQTCETDSGNPFVDAPTPDGFPTFAYFAGSDGQRMLFNTGNDRNDEVAAIDGATGQEVWRKSDPNLWLPQWMNSGIYSVRAYTASRWF